MDSTSFDEVVFDPSKCTKLSMEEKRELVYELSKWPYSAQEMLQTWSRQEILQILCAEMGKERKYTGLTKLKIIENLLKIISEKKLKECGSVNDVKSQASLENSQRASKRPRKTDHPIRLPSAANNVSLNKVDVDLANVIFCKNSACRAKLSQEDAFCKRCSCCICHQYDDNKDPSLWLVCSSEPPYLGFSCGMSCHLECAFKHEKSGIISDRLDKGLDGIFHCISCGKVNDLLGCWRKQLIIARDTRRVDILCYRVSLSQKLLFGIRRYQKLQEIVDEAVQKLENDVGPLTGLPVKMARGIVNRLSSGAEVQRLCSLAVDSFDSMFCNTNSNVSCNAMNQGTSLKGPNVITFEDVSTSSVAVIFNCEDSTLEKSFTRCSIWHRKSDMDYSAEPTCTLFPPNTSFLLSNLTPTTVYQFKVVFFDSDGEVGTYVVQHETSSPGFDAKITNPKTMAEDRSKSPATNSSSLSNPSSVEDEANNVMSYANEIKNGEDPLLTYCENADKLVSADISNDTTERTGTVGDPVSMLDEERTTQKSDSMHNSDAIEIENKHSPDGQNIEETSTDNGSATPILTGMECVPIVGTFKAGLPTTPCKLENIKDGMGRNGKSKLCNKNRDNETVVEEEQVGSSSKKRKGEGQDRECAGTGGKDFEYYVKVIRWLECDGHIEATFRQKFLTWYSLRATPQEVRIVKAFVDTLFEDPASLAGQLVDTFSDVITSNRSRVVPSGFFLKLWH